MPFCQNRTLRSASAVILTVIAASLLAGCQTTGSNSGPPGEFHWKFSTWGKPRAFSSGIDALAKYVDRKSDGKFTISVHYGEELGKSKQNLQAVGDGEFQMANYCTAYHPSRTPSVWGLDLPFLPFDDLATQRRVYDTFHARADVRAEMADAGVRYQFAALLPRYELMGMGNAPQSIVDLKGKKIRALGAMGRAMRTWGAEPINLPSTGVYPALQSRYIDAAAFPYTFTFKAYKIHHIAEWYTSNFVLGAIHCPVIVNQVAYASLPEKFKKLMDDGRTIAYNAMLTAYRKQDEQSLKLFDSRGLKRIEFSVAERLEITKFAGLPHWQDWIVETDARGLPGRSLLMSILTEGLRDKDPVLRRGVMAMVRGNDKRPKSTTRRN
jgi:TRAP-type C4-dicarboxylate transport system substrate-binding protein